MSLKKFWIKKCRIVSQSAATAISPPAMRMPLARENFWGGKPDAAWMICAPTHGAGNPIILQVIPEKCDIDFRHSVNGTVACQAGQLNNYYQ